MTTAAGTAAVTMPRAAVSIVVRFGTKGRHTGSNNRDRSSLFLLVKRGQPPNKGQWSLPGGKLHAGETLLEGAKRELQEETQLSSSSLRHKQQELNFYPHAFHVTESLHWKNDKNKQDRKSSSLLEYHYIISQYFAYIDVEENTTAALAKNDKKDTDSSTPPRLVASDDAADAKWFSLAAIRQMQDASTTNAVAAPSVMCNVTTTPGLYHVLERAEALYQHGFLTCE